MVMVAPFKAEESWVKKLHKLAKGMRRSIASLLREAMEDLVKKYKKAKRAK